MHEIDLIPLSYRKEIAKLIMVKRFGILALAVFVLCISSYFVLIQITKELKNEAVSLQKQKLALNKKRASIAQTQQQQNRLQQQWRDLKKLRSNVSVRSIFKSIDSALPKGVWFLSWKFQRAGIIEINEKRSPNKHLIMLPKNSSNEKLSGTLLQTNMTIRGQALDHAALSTLVQRLYIQPEILNVRVLNTVLRRYSSNTVIEFNLEVTINTRLAKRL